MRQHRFVEASIASFILTILLCGMFIWPVAAEEQGTTPPELKLSLRDAIQAAIDNNVNVRLLKERIAAAQSQANTSLGALLPNVGGYLNGRNQTVNLAAFGLPSERLAGLGLTRSVTDPFEVYDARATLVQNIFSLIQRLYDNGGAQHRLATWQRKKTSADTSRTPRGCAPRAHANLHSAG
jgi:hypothetical protein